MKAKWIIRIVLGVGLAAALVLAFLDYRAKSAAETTADAWFELMDRRPAISLLESQMKGSPEIEVEDSSSSDQTDIGYSWVTYRWSGVLRDYRIEVVAEGMSENFRERRVIRVEGPLTGESQEDN